MQEPTGSSPPSQPPAAIPRTRRSRALWLLILPYIALLFPAFYARTTPTLFGIPFFYWYQFAWVIIASTIMGFVYTRIKERET